METDPGHALSAEIVALQADDLPALGELLTGSGLPADDCAGPQNQFFGIFENRRLVAAGGLEAAGSYCLLRSLVVAPRHRGRGLARAITGHLLVEARARQRTAVYLLTETAAAYFENFGFCKVSRAAVPAAIAATSQFVELCPDSAECLILPLAEA